MNDTRGMRADQIEGIRTRSQLDLPIAHIGGASPHSSSMVRLETAELARPRSASLHLSHRYCDTKRLRSTAFGESILFESLLVRLRWHSRPSNKSLIKVLEQRAIFRHAHSLFRMWVSHRFRERAPVAREIHCRSPK